MSRRTAIKLAVVAVVGTAMGAGSLATIRRLGAETPRSYRFFSDSEAALVTAICEQIIPRDDTPGAADTGAVRYIDEQLTGFFAIHRQSYRRGLESFRLTCVRQFGKRFQDLAPENKIEFLRAVETGRVPKSQWPDPSPVTFFNLVLAHTMQGFYGSPRHGGNRDYASYRILGLEAPQVLGRNPLPRT